MDNTNLFSILTEKIITAEQLSQCLELLRQTKEGLYKKDSNAKEVLEKTLPYFIADMLFVMAEKNAVVLTDTNRLQELINEIQSYLEKITIVEIVITYVPTYRHIQELAAWWEKYTGKHIVLSIKIDENLIVGAQISYEGIYKDYSLSQWLKQNTTGDIDQFN